MLIYHWVTGRYTPVSLPRLGTRWVERGEGDTLAELISVFGFGFATMRNKDQKARTDLRLTGHPLTQEDVRRFEVVFAPREEP